MLLGPHVVVGLTCLLEGELLLVHDGVDVVGLDGGNHILHLGLGADEDAAGGADAAEDVQESRLGLGAAEEADDADDALHLDGGQRVLHGVGTADLEDVVHTLAVGGQALGRLAPVGVLIVVYDVVGTELLEHLTLLLGRGGGDDRGASSLGELQGEDADTASALGEDVLAGLQGLEAVQGVPGGQGGTGKCGALSVVQVLGSANQAVLFAIKVSQASGILHLSGVNCSLTSLKVAY